jgi:hypothetical protein
MIELEIDPHALQEVCRLIGFYQIDRQFDSDLLKEALSEFQSALDDYAERQYILRTTY